MRKGNEMSRIQQDLAVSVMAGVAHQSHEDFPGAPFDFDAALSDPLQSAHADENLVGLNEEDPSQPPFFTAKLVDGRASETRKIFYIDFH
jgi:hypothetical protein